MKDCLLAVVFRLFHKMGFYPQRIFSPKETYWNLLDYPQELRAYLLKRITHFIRIENNQAYYKELLKTYVPDWNIGIQKSAFIGSGQGENCLNAYRKVSIADKDYLEKVYFTPSRDLKVLEWLRENIYSNLKDRIKMPAIDYIFKSKELSIIYFEFLNLKPLSDNNIKQELIRLSHELYWFSTGRLTENSVQKAPLWIRDYHEHFMYKRNFDFAKNKLQEKGIDIRILEQQIEDSQYILTHGDLWSSNIFAGSILIDWDSSGIYPMGMDPAFLFYRLLFENREKDIHFLQWLSSNYKTVILQKDWQAFERNFCYFLFIFVCRMPQNRFGNIKEELSGFLKNVSGPLYPTIK